MHYFTAKGASVNDSTNQFYNFCVGGVQWRFVGAAGSASSASASASASAFAPRRFSVASIVQQALSDPSRKERRSKSKSKSKSKAGKLQKGKRKATEAAATPASRRSVKEPQLSPPPSVEVAINATEEAVLRASLQSPKSWALDHLFAGPKNCEAGVKSRFVGFGDGERCSVETLCLQWYAQPSQGSWSGKHCEGRPLISLFSLLLWDAMWHRDAKGGDETIWMSPFQENPLDLYTKREFYPRRVTRRIIVDEALARVRDSSAAELVLLVATQYRAHHGIACRGISWRGSLVEERGGDEMGGEAWQQAWTQARSLALIAACIGGPALTRLLHWIAIAYRERCSGLPDLLLWRLGSTSRRGKEKVNADAMEKMKMGMEMETKVKVKEDVEEDEERSGADDDDGDALDAASESSWGSGVAALQREVERGDCAARFVEVKGPNDRLAEHQIIWLNFMALGNAVGAGVDARVCRVNRTQPSRTTSQASP